MAKHLIDSDIWDSPAFLDAEIKHKLLAVYLVSKCDCAGIIPFNTRIVSMLIGVDVSESDLAYTPVKLLKIGDFHYWLVNYCSDQYKVLKSSSKVHCGVVSRLYEFGLLQYVDISQDFDFSKVKSIPEGFTIDSHCMPSLKASDSLLIGYSNHINSTKEKEKKKELEKELIDGSNSSLNQKPNTERDTREEAQPDGTEHGKNGHPDTPAPAHGGDTGGSHGCGMDGHGAGDADADQCRADQCRAGHPEHGHGDRTPQGRAGQQGRPDSPPKVPAPYAQGELDADAGLLGAAPDPRGGMPLGGPQEQTMTPAHGGPDATTNAIAPLDGATVDSQTAKRPALALEATNPSQSIPERKNGAQGAESARKKPVPVWKSHEEFAQAAHEAADGKYSPATMENFIAYWTEPNAKGKMRWQAESFFDMARRIANSARMGYGVEPFTPPTGSEVRAYAAEKGMPEQWANEFHGHYKSVGWMVGKVKMADWKAKLAIWCNAQLKREAV